MLLFAPKKTKPQASTILMKAPAPAASAPSLSEQRPRMAPFTRFVLLLPPPSVETIPKPAGNDSEDLKSHQSGRFAKLLFVWAGYDSRHNSAEPRYVTLKSFTEGAPVTC